MKNKKRIFFALWPDEQTRQTIADAFNKTDQAKQPGRCLSAVNLHLTLHFLGNVSQEMYSCVEEVAQTVTVDPFELNLNHYDCFSKAKIFWLGPEMISAALIQLHTDLASALSSCGFTAETRPFNPHITLMRKIKSPVDAIQPEPVIWRVNRFALVESISVEAGGVEYRAVRFFCL